MGLPEIIPPQRGQVTRIEPARIHVNVPSVNVGGPISSHLNAWIWDQQAKANNALARLNEAEAKNTIAQTALVVAEVERRTRLFELQELPRKLGHEFAVREVVRANEFRAVQHVFERDEINRSKEIAMAEADRNQARVLRTHSQTALADAQQQLEAQLEYGQMHYVLAHKKKALEIMDVELDIEERKSLLKDYLAKGTDQAAAQTDDLTEQEIDDALQMRLQQLNAAGMDTSRVEAAIAARRKK